MKVTLLLATLYFFLSCSDSGVAQTTLPERAPVDNHELAGLHESDQADRGGTSIDWASVGPRDSLREIRVYELLDSSKVVTSTDYHNAAMIFQHGRDSVAYGMAVKMMRKSVELDSTANKWLLAAAIDRDLGSRGKPQIYGTQYTKSGPDAPWELADMDTTQITAAQRAEYGVRTLAEQRARVKQMNMDQLGDLEAGGKSIEEIIEFIESEDLTTSSYDLSESAINSFGYTLIESGRAEEALPLFKLNTELYPEGFNTHDSYGECLLLLGEKELGIAAYKKSLELNPENDIARAAIEKSGL